MPSPNHLTHALLTASLLCVAAPAQAREPEQGITVGGALRANLFYKTWEGEEDNRNRFGDVAFDTFRLNVDGRLSNVLLSAEYRLYAGYHMLHHGWVGYAFDDATQVQLGVHQVPFGLQPYASHNWFFALPYYLGFEDDYDLGVKFLHARGPWNLQLAFYKNDEGSYSGGSTDSARYSYDVVAVRASNPSEAYLGVESANTETNQANARLTYRFEHGALGNTEVGLSAQAGQIYNGITRSNGLAWAGAAHVNGNYGRFNVKLEALRYAYDLANPEGVDGSVVTVGAYDAPYKLASRGAVFVAGVSYDVPVSWGPISKLTFYDDYSLLKKLQGGADSHQNVLGVMVTAGPVYTYFDAASGKNQPWLGPNYGAALAEGDAGAAWETRYNVNVGYYF